MGDTRVGFSGESGRSEATGSEKCNDVLEFRGVLRILWRRKGKEGEREREKWEKEGEKEGREGKGRKKKINCNLIFFFFRAIEIKRSQKKQEEKSYWQNSHSG